MFYRMLIWLGILISIVLPHSGTADEMLWITGYLPSYYQDDSGNLIFTMSKDDFKKVTHLSHHGPYVNRDGSFNYAPTKYSDVKAAKIVEIAHAHHVPVLLCVVSWQEYRFAIENKMKRTTLINNILQLLDTKGYDGVDVDLEPVISPHIADIQKENPNYIAFVRQLYDSLQVRKSLLLNRAPLLTTAVNGIAGPVLAKIDELFDQINLMTYDMSQPWEGWPVWHDAAIHNTGYSFPGILDLHSPSLVEEISKCLAPGIPAQKLGIGVSCDAFQWKGGTGTSSGGAAEPLQQWTTPPVWSRFAYKDMMANHYRQEYYRWDDVAKMSYLSIDRNGSAEDEFWSYNDERSCFEKIDFVKNNHLGGVIIWELGSGYCAGSPEVKRLPQLSALYNAKMDLQTPVVYLLTVKNGYNGGNYQVGTIVNIKVDEPSVGKIFSAWTGDTAFVADVYASKTTITMPDTAVTVIASYKDR